MKSRERERQARVACEEALTERSTQLTDQFAFPSFFFSNSSLFYRLLTEIPKKDDDEDLSLT